VGGLSHPEPPRVCHLWQANRQKNQPFPNSKKKFGGGNLRKRQRGWLVGRVRACPHRRRGSELAFCAKMGSSERVKSLQEEYFYSLSINFFNKYKKIKSDVK